MCDPPAPSPAVLNNVLTAANSVAVRGALDAGRFRGVSYKRSPVLC